MALRFCKSRTYHDPLHGAISLDGGDSTEALLIRLIDTPPFQRLRRIRQLDAASFTFHGAEGSRFTHSVGVLHTARRVFDKMAKRHSDLRPYRALVLASALLHDIGHSPFSHAGEEMFGCHHEHWTRRIIAEDPSIAQLLSEYDPSLPEQMQQVVQKTFSLPVVGQLVSSQLDCDRLDYLLRDSLLTGAQYGRLDLDRILTVMDYDPDTGSLKISARKGLGPIEHYLVVRYFMYTQVYQHPKSLAARFVQDRLFHRARVLYQAGDLELDPILAAWMSQTVDDLP
ncbi:MAG: HD domain-containing protein, partial [Cyanophyceae cyanobacterium]